MRRNESRCSKKTASLRMRGNELACKRATPKASTNSGRKKPDRTSVQSGPSSGCSFGSESIGDAAHAAADDVPVLTALQLV